MVAGVDRRAMAALSGGHLATDFASGAVPALLPFLVLEFGLTYTLTAVIMLAATISSSLVQPVFGFWSDRRGAMWLLPGGVALAGIGIGLAAVAPSYALVVVLIFMSGIGIAAYHPEGAKFATFASGKGRASGMSLFNIGGNTGFALAPIVITPLVLWLGLEGALLAVVPVLIVAVLVGRALPYLARLRPPTDQDTAAAGKDEVRAMTLLAGVIALRSVAWFGLLTFIPLWAVSLGHSNAAGNRLLALLLVSGAVGTLLLGPVADRIGLRRTMLVTQAAIGPLILVFILVGGPVGALALALVGICVVGSFGPTIVLSQLYLPQHMGMASGLAVGLAIGLGGVAAVMLGAIADVIDLRAALLVCAAAPAVGVIFCLLLPAPARPGQLVPEPATP